MLALVSSDHQFFLDDKRRLLAAVLYYDCALTFGMEVKYMWCQKFRISTVLYVFCRYGLVANIVYLLTISGKINLRVRLPALSMRVKN
jgi:Family of unknown function (DUF6533)